MNLTGKNAAKEREREDPATEWKRNSEIIWVELHTVKLFRFKDQTIRNQFELITPNELDVLFTNSETIFLKIIFFESKRNRCYELN